MISFIIPAYNCAKTICRTIDSILSQNSDKVEIIVIDDGSTDDTARIIKNNYGHNPKIIYSYQKNKGPGAARNYGINISSGDWMFFIDSDDYLQPNIISFYEELTKEEIDAIYPSLFFETTGKNLISKRLFHVKKRVLQSNYFLNKYLLDKCSAWRVSAVMYRASIVKANNLRFPATKNAEDFMFNVSFLLNCNKVCVLKKETLVVYRHPGSLTSTYINNLSDINESLTNYLLHIEGSKISKTSISSFAIRNYIIFTIQEVFKSSNSNKEIKKRVLEEYKRVKINFKKSRNKAFFNSFKKKIVYWICFIIIKLHMPRFELLFLFAIRSLFPKALER